MVFGGEQLIYVDSRESIKVQKLAKSYLKAEVALLPVGDFVCGNVCIERKTITDFLGSLTSKRLHNQILRMKANFDHSIVIVVGKEYDVQYTGWSAQQFNGKLMSTAMDYDIKVMRTDTDVGFMSLAKSAFKRSDTNLEFVEHNIKRIAPRSDDVYVNMVCAIPGIGEKLAKEILKVFTVKQLFEITEKDLRNSVDGIGKKKAEDIKKVCK